MPELRRPESEKERQCAGNIAGCHGGGAAGVGLQGDFNSKEAAVGSACRHTIPTWHCGPGTGAERAHSGLGALYALTAQPLGLAWQTEHFQGSQGHRMKPDKARQAGENG